METEQSLTIQTLEGPEMSYNKYKGHVFSFFCLVSWFSSQRHDVCGVWCMILKLMMPLLSPQGAAQMGTVL